MRTSQELRAALAAAIDKHDASVHRHRERVSSGLITEAGYTEAVRADSTTAGLEGQVRSVLTELDERQTAAQATIDREHARVTEPATGTATEQLLDENRAVRAWERLRTRLAARNPIMAAYEGLRAVSEATGDERRIIVEELPSYIVGIDQRPVTPADIRKAIADGDEAYAQALAFCDATDDVASYLRSAAETTLKIVQGDQLSDNRGDIVVRNGTAPDFPATPRRSHSRTPEQRAADAKALSDHLDRR